MQSSESPDQGPTGALVYLGLVVREMQTNKKKAGPCGKITSFSCPPQLFAAESRATCSNIPLGRLEDNLTYYNQGSWVPKAVSDTNQDALLITGLSM